MMPLESTTRLGLRGTGIEQSRRASCHRRRRCCRQRAASSWASRGGRRANPRSWTMPELPAEVWRTSSPPCASCAPRPRLSTSRAGGPRAAARRPVRRAGGADPLPSAGGRSAARAHPKRRRAGIAVHRCARIVGGPDRGNWGVATCCASRSCPPTSCDSLRSRSAGRRGRRKQTATAGLAALLDTRGLRVQAMYGLGTAVRRLREGGDERRAKQTLDIILGRLRTAKGSQWRPPCGRFLVMLGTRRCVPARGAAPQSRQRRRARRGRRIVAAD